MRKLSCWSLFMAVLLLAGCRQAAAPAKAAAAPPDPLTTDLDTAVSPGANFFTYADGGWLARNPIPATESSWGIGNQVQNEIYARLRTISEQAARTQAAPGSDDQKIGDFWAMAMDPGHADAVGLAPIEPELRQIAAVRTGQQALEVACALQPLGLNTFFRLGVEQDDKDSAVMAVHLGQGGLGLPNRDFYFNPEPGVAKIRQEYVAHLQRTLQLLGDHAGAAARGAAGVMRLETALARASRPLAALRDPYKNYNPMAPALLTRRYSPAVDWAQELAGWHLATARVIVGQPEFFAGLNRALQQTPVAVLRDYLRLHLLDRYAPYLSQALVQEHFRFYNTDLSGQKQPRPQWKQALAAENQALGMVLGRKFVHAYFPPAEKERYTKLVEAIRTAFRHRIEKLDWMSPATKRQALAKLAAVTPKVGYPDKWRNYSGLAIGRSSYAENMMNAARWRFQDMVSKFGKPVDRTEWDMTPQTYNAYYNPSNNEIVLPAAQFAVPGVPDADLDDAIVYGYSGASTIGHEITHGFDDEGRHYDAQGNLKDWWTAQDAARFDQRAEVMVKEFDAYQPIPGLHIRGQACLGENIADYGGILLGLDAFQQTAEYKAGKKVDGLTPLQRFFLGYALGWLSQERQASLRRQLLSDVHAPAEYRVIGPLSNIPAFYQAFGVKPGQAMWRPAADRVQIW
ncbi:MAG TPA: M13 family metallopeptidase [Terriglobales bacterium]|nr:M13 family metallopeptidase [Terriglobales bacterium]